MFKYLSAMLLVCANLINTAYSSDSAQEESINSGRRVYIFKMSQDQREIQSLTTAYVVTESLRTHPHRNTLEPLFEGGITIPHTPSISSWVVIDTNREGTSYQKGQIVSGYHEALSTYLVSEYNCPTNVINPEKIWDCSINEIKIRYFTKNLKDCKESLTLTEKRLLTPINEQLVFSRQL